MIASSLWLWLCSMVLLFSAAAHAGEAGFEFIGKRQVENLSELSGLAVSQRNPRRYWGLNDSGHAASLFVLDPGPQLYREIAIEGALNHDWEDLASFRLDGKPYLLVADTGNNFSFRGEVSLLLLLEPEHDADQASVEREIRFVFEDGSRDCEAIAVDAVNRQVLLADKGRVPVGLYAVSLDADGKDVVVARRIGDFPDLVPTPSPRVQRLGSARGRGTPTAMDLSSDGRQLAVISYIALNVFDRKPEQTWAEALAKPLISVRLPPVSGFESLAFSADGNSLLLGTEGVIADYYRWTPESGSFAP